MFPKLKLVLEGLIQVPLERQIEEIGNTTYISSSICLEEDIGTLPFLVEIYSPTEASSYMARKDVGHYVLTQIDEHFRLNLEGVHPASRLTGIHIVLPRLEEWKGKSNRILVYDNKNLLILGSTCKGGSNLIFLPNSLFIHIGIERVEDLKISVF